MTPGRAHFQLTRHCNLACKFCGQSKGAPASGKTDLRLADWLRLARELKASADRPVLTLRGGEPLFYRDFPELARELFGMDCKLRIVPDGTLIDRHATCSTAYSKVINVSVDGYGASGDGIRGVGTFERVAANLRLLKARRGKLCLLLTVGEHNTADLPPLRLTAAINSDLQTQSSCVVCGKVERRSLGLNDTCETLRNHSGPLNKIRACVPWSRAGIGMFVWCMLCRFCFF